MGYRCSNAKGKRATASKRPLCQRRIARSLVLTTKLNCTAPAVAQHGGGHATLFPAPSEMRTEIPVFEPQSKALAGLSRRLKAAFDPYAILEPRRMWVEF